ncbi:MAG: hypothetical protein M9897_00260 [Brumimicrobium sp.]|nr:hypothetical protein [Brumimicrobium sp.]
MSYQFLLIKNPLIFIYWHGENSPQIIINKALFKEKFSVYHFSSKEIVVCLDEYSVILKFSITASDGKEYQTNHFVQFMVKTLILQLSLAYFHHSYYLCVLILIHAWNTTLEQLNKSGEGFGKNIKPMLLKWIRLNQNIMV